MGVAAGAGGPEVRCSRQRTPNAHARVRRERKLVGADAYGETPLHIAAFKSKEGEMVQMLLDYGAYVNTVTSEGDTPLAQGLNHPPIVRILLAAGADVHARERVTQRSIRHHLGRRQRKAGGGFDEEISIVGRGGKPFLEGR